MTARKSAARKARTPKAAPSTVHAGRATPMARTSTRRVTKPKAAPSTMPRSRVHGRR